MKLIQRWTIVALSATLVALAQPVQSGKQIHFVSSDPTGNCGNAYITVNTSTGNIRVCAAGTWADAGGGGGGGLPAWITTTDSPNTLLANGLFTVAPAANGIALTLAPSGGGALSATGDALGNTVVGIESDSGGRALALTTNGADGQSIITFSANGVQTDSTGAAGDFNVGQFQGAITGSNVAGDSISTLLSYVENDGTGTAGTLSAYYANVANNGTVANLYGLYVDEPVVGTVTNTAAAIFVDDWGASNFAIKTGTGKVSFGDTVSAAGGSDTHTVCWKDTVLSYCTSVVGVDGTCTCH